MRNLMLLACLAVFLAAKGQDTLQQSPIRTIVKPAYLPGMLQGGRVQNKVYDSLLEAAVLLRNQNDSLLLLINDELVKSQSLEAQNKKLADEVRNLHEELSASKGEQLQTSHTSSVLMIFNIIAGLILLTALAWIFTRKKHGAAPDTETPVRPLSVASSLNDPVETRMERIEKLGRLRDKGLLTEDEFQLQKRQLLG